MSLKRANETFWAPGNRLVRAGDLVPADDPVLNGRDHLFSPIAAPPAAGNGELLDRIARLEELLAAAKPSRRGTSS